MIRIRREEGARQRGGRKGSFLGVRRKVDECADLGRKQGNATFYTGGIKLAREKKRKWRNRLVLELLSFLPSILRGAKLKKIGSFVIYD